jgi:hypothetical protein
MLQLFNSDHESDSVRKYDNLNLNQQSAKRFDHIFEGNSGPHNNFLDKQSKRPSKLFGLLHAPNQRTVVREAKILAIVNKVFEWFDNKSLEEKEKLIKEALDAAPKLESDAAKQVKALEDATWKKLLEQKEADDKAEKVKSRKEREAVEKVAKYGGHWKSISSMNLALGAFGSESEKKKAIVDNLRYHKLILKTTSSNSKLFTITSGGQAKTLSTLIENLSALITTANQNTTEDDDQDDNEY